MATKVANIMGPTGPHGTPAWTITSGTFTVPPIGGTVTVTVNDPTWIAVNEVVWVMGANGSGQAGQLRVQSIAGNNVTLINSSSVLTTGDMLRSVYDTNLDGITDHAALADNATNASAVPWTGVTGKVLASATGSGLLNQVSGNTTDFVDGSNNVQNLANAIANLFVWTGVTLTVVPGSGTITTQSSACGYIKIGKLVILRIWLNVANIGSATGTTTISGLPFAPVSGAVIYLREIAINGLGYSFSIGSGTTTGAVITSGGNASPAWANGIIYIGQGVYQTT